VLISIQVLSVLVYVILSLDVVFGYNNASTYSDFPGDPVQLAWNLFTWIILHAPGTAIIYTACSLLPQAAADWRWRVRLAQWHESKWPRLHTRGALSNHQSLSRKFVFSSLVHQHRSTLRMATLCNLGLIFPLGQFLMTYIVGIILFIGIPWYIVLHRKLRGRV
jgi:hypothetical protein